MIWCFTDHLLFFAEIIEMASKEAYSEPCQASRMELFVKIVGG